jgi:hypothetical protein
MKYHTTRSLYAYWKYRVSSLRVSPEQGKWELKGNQTDKSFIFLHLWTTLRCNIFKKLPEKFCMLGEPNF